MPLRKGQFVHFTRAHDSECNIWAIVQGRDCRKYMTRRPKYYIAHVVAGSNSHWRPWSHAQISDTPEETQAWQNGAVRYTFVPPRKVPDWVFVKMAVSALTE